LEIFCQLPGNLLLDLLLNFGQPFFSNVELFILLFLQENVSKWIILINIESSPPGILNASLQDLKPMYLFNNLFLFLSFDLLAILRGKCAILNFYVDW
jgi:hypothetical protein